MNAKGYVSDGQLEEARAEAETSKGSVALAESELRRARDRVAWAEKMHAKGFVSGSQLDSERASLQRAEIQLGADDEAVDRKPAPGDSPGLKRAKDRLQWAETMRAKGYVSDSQVEDAREAVRNAAAIQRGLSKERDRSPSDRP